MNLEEMNEIMAWLKGYMENIEEKPIEDQLSISMAMLELAKKLKPIYVKDKMKRDDKFVIRL